ncbi:MAG: DNA mismatch endonuclease Vsr [Burkholderiales bacterium]|nr:DNA mismatch endonuclease Vsr [Burkholderiales bacterium]
MDTLSKSERSARMGLIKSRDTEPELILQRLVGMLGYRYRLHDKTLSGRPDLVFPSRHKVIFMHGCFWHGHNRCQLARLPKSRPEFWLPKFKENKRRDRAIRCALTRQGWENLVLWECELRDPVRVMIKVLVFLEG